MKVSLCISTWNRAELLKKLIINLEQQNFQKNEYEIIVADSLSNDNTKKYMYDLKMEFDNLIYINDLKNIPQCKRNKAVSISRGEVIILLDDDVIPKDENFIFNHYYANVNNEKCFFSGQVRFPIRKVNFSNYYRFRDDQHFPDKNSSNDILFNRIVTMNMSFKKEYFNIVGEFDERFLGYGCEDIEFGYRINSAGFHNKYLNSACVMHYEESNNIIMYSKKIYFCSVYGKRNLYKYNRNAYQSLFNSYTDVINIRNDFIFNIVFRYIIVGFLLIFDRFSFLYFYLLYKYFIYNIYYQGYKQWNKVKYLENDWVK